MLIPGGTFPPLGDEGNGKNVEFVRNRNTELHR